MESLVWEIGELGVVVLVQVEAVIIQVKTEKVLLADKVIYGIKTA